jgi:hypothetical protein
VIAFTGTLRIYADTDEQVDEVLRRLAQPTKGVTVHVVEASRSAS